MLRASLFASVAVALAIGSGTGADEKKVDKKADKGSRFVATVTAKDPDKHTLTVKIRAKKDESRTIDLKAEGLKLVAEDGKVHTETEFLKDLDIGEEVVLLEKEGKLVEVRDLPPKK